MLAIYLAATIVGVALVGASLIGGHHDGDTPGDSELSHGDHGTVSTLASLRFWSFLLAFGGITGLLLLLVAHTAPLVGGVISAAVGIGCGVTASVLVRRLSSVRGGTVQTGALVGSIGHLLLPAARGVSSRVRLTIDHAIVDLIAVTDEDIPAREEVLIVEMKDGVAHVTRNPAREKV